ncbi:MAG TPA: VOC family protein [Acidimicrobiales bacterium]
MTVRLANVTFDCDDVMVVARFWSAAVGRPLAEEPAPSEYFASIGGIDHGTADGVNWLFAKVPEPKTAKNRMHVDMVAPDRHAEVARLVGLGATKVADHDEWGAQWTVLTDPEGNEFCVAQA